MSAFKCKVLDKMSEQWPVFTGNFQCANEYLAEKSSRSSWLILQFLNSLGRSFGQVIFANNPVSGSIIMLGIGVADYFALLAGIYAATISFVFALVTRQNSEAILNGWYGFNPVLHGVVSVGYLPLLYSQIKVDTFEFWGLLTITALLQVYMTSAFINLLSNITKYPLPSFSLPFNILQLLLINCLLRNVNVSFKPSNDSVVFVNETDTFDIDNTNYTTYLNWGEFFSGTIVSISQVYSINNIPCACLMFLGMFIFSPLMAGFGYLGSFSGTLMGVAFTNDYNELYNGIWGFNGLLCMAALSSFCYALSIQSTLIGVAAVVFSVALQHTLTPIFATIHLPILILPFNITAIIFLLVTTEKDKTLIRPSTLTFPEKHRLLRSN